MSLLQVTEENVKAVNAAITDVADFGVKYFYEFMITKSRTIREFDGAKDIKTAADAMSAIAKYKSTDAEFKFFLTFDPRAWMSKAKELKQFEIKGSKGHIVAEVKYSKAISVQTLGWSELPLAFLLGEPLRIHAEDKYKVKYANFVDLWVHKCFLAMSNWKPGTNSTVQNWLDAVKRRMSKYIHYDIIGGHAASAKYAYKCVGAWAGNVFTTHNSTGDQFILSDLESFYLKGWKEAVAQVTTTSDASQYIAPILVSKTKRFGNLKVEDGVDQSKVDALDQTKINNLRRWGVTITVAGVADGAAFEKFYEKEKKKHDEKVEEAAEKRKKKAAKK